MDEEEKKLVFLIAAVLFAMDAHDSSKGIPRNAAEIAVARATVFVIYAIKQLDIEPGDV